MGTRLDVLMDAAGLTSITAINDLLEFVPHYDTDPAISQGIARQWWKRRAARGPKWVSDADL
jgi:hypothetical protein